MTRFLRIVVLALCLGAISSPSAASALGLSVSGKWMRWADRLGISYIGWAWDTKGGWTRHARPSLIQNYRGKPTGFGIGLRNHLLRLRRHARR